MIAPREKLDTQFLLKIGNPAGKRWLSDVQLLCRMSEFFLSGGRQKIPKHSQFHFYPSKGNYITFNS